MRQLLRRGLLVFAALGLAATILVGGVSPANGGPPPSERTTISFDRATCAITGTYSWKNHDLDVGEQVWIGVYRDGYGYVYGPMYSTVAQATDSVSVTYTGTPGGKYFVNGNMPLVEGTFDSSRPITCR